MTTAIPFDLLFQPATAAQYDDSQLAIAKKIGIPSTDWNAGAPTRTEFAALANVAALTDVEVSILAQAGFLDFAASEWWPLDPGQNQVRYHASSGTTAGSVCELTAWPVWMP